MKIKRFSLRVLTLLTSMIILSGEVYADGEVPNVIPDGAGTGTNVQEIAPIDTNNTAPQVPSTNPVTGETVPTTAPVSNTNNADSTKAELSQASFDEITNVLKQNSTLTGGLSDDQVRLMALSISDIISTFQAKYNASDNAISAILCNIAAESKFDPFVVQGVTTHLFEGATLQENCFVMKTEVDYTSASVTSGGAGLFQWTDTATKNEVGDINSISLRRKNASDYFERLSGNKILVKAKFRSYELYDEPSDPMRHRYRAIYPAEMYLGSTQDQVLYYVENDTNWQVGDSHASMMGLTGDEARAKFPDFRTFLTSNEDVQTLTSAFCLFGEINGGKDSTTGQYYFTQRYNSYGATMQALLGNPYIEWGYTTSLAQMNADEQVAQLKAMATSGYWSTAELSDYVKLCEINVQDEFLKGALRGNLTQLELASLTAWELNVQTDVSETFLVKGGRFIVILFGIILLVWALLVYIAYWFDRLNNIIEFDALSFITLGRLRVYDGFSEPTYSLTGKEHKGKVKTVNHRAVLFIVFVAIFAGVLIISGQIFNILSWIILKVTNFFK